MVRTIALTQGMEALVDDEDYDRVAAFPWYARKGHCTYYAVTKRYTGYSSTVMHHLILPPRAGYVIDHRNRNGLDNRRENLRYATPSQSLINRGIWRQGKYRGVYLKWRRPLQPIPLGQKRRGRKPAGPRWEAKINVGGRQVSLGYYATPEQAARAYDEAARQHHGEFAVLNFPEEQAKP